MNYNKIGFTKVSFDVLGKAIALPLDHEIVDVYLDYQDNKQGIIRVVIAGPMMPDYKKGEKIKEVLIHIQQKVTEWLKVDPV